MVKQVTLLVGTKKGMYTLQSDDGRAKWSLDGPRWSPAPVYHATRDPRRSGRKARVPTLEMSLPSKKTAPSVGSSSRTIVRPSVDFPQPDSPTRPRVSPSRTPNVTSSTACTRPTSRWSNPLRMGKREPSYPTPCPTCGQPS